MEVKQVGNYVGLLGESPHWEKGVLHFVDAFQGRVCRWDGTSTVFKPVGNGSQVVSMVIPTTAPGRLLVSLHDELRLLDWESGDWSRVLARCEPGPRTTVRFNDGKCDSKGRLYAGTMGMESRPTVLEPEQGTLYCLRPGPKEVLRPQVRNITLSNGLTWSQDQSTLFFVDSVPGRIHALRVDPSTGEIDTSNSKVLVEFDKVPDLVGVPDGMTSDLQGKLWVACYDGGCVVALDPETGARLRKVELPVSKVTSCCFGGPDYGDLYVTTARFGLSEGAEQPLAGATFHVANVGAKGSPAHHFSLLE